MVLFFLISDDSVSHLIAIVLTDDWLTSCSRSVVHVFVSVCSIVVSQLFFKCFVTDFAGKILTVSRLYHEIMAVNGKLQKLE